MCFYGSLSEAANPAPMIKHERSRDLFALQSVAFSPNHPLRRRIAAARLVIAIRERDGLPLQTRPTWRGPGCEHVATQRPWHALLARLESFAA